MAKDSGCGKEVVERDGPGGWAGGAAGCKVVGFVVEEGWQVLSAGVVLGRHPQFVVGAQTEKGGREALPEELEECELGWGPGLGAEKGGGAIDGGLQATGPPLQEVQGNQAGEPLHTCGGSPDTDPEPGGEDNARVGGVEHDSTTALAPAECRIGGDNQVVVRGQNGRVGVIVNGHVRDRGVPRGAASMPRTTARERYRAECWGSKPRE